MKNHRIFVISLVALLLFIAGACNFSASTANIKNAYTARTDNGEPNRRLFSRRMMFSSVS